MCRNIRTLHHFEPPATEAEVRASALQYVRKLTGLKSFSKANKHACDHAVDDITAITLRLFGQLEVHGPPRSREAEQHKAAMRGKKREEQLRARVLRDLG
jgi:hypothetical protein